MSLPSIPGPLSALHTGLTDETIPRSAGPIEARDSHGSLSSAYPGMTVPGEGDEGLHTGGTS